jgi:uncharacterized protein YdeI (YjbR/CyaY-like superfamily)
MWLVPAAKRVLRTAFRNNGIPKLAGEKSCCFGRIWLGIYKKDSGVVPVTYPEPLDQVLCFGWWIDGQKKPYDNQSWLQKFTPRRAKAHDLKKNTEHVARLIKSGQMVGAWLEAVEAAKMDGRWQAAYDSFRNAAPPSDFLAELDKNKKAKAFF